MLTLYFRPMACSLASRIAILEAGLEADYCHVDLTGKRIVEGGGDYLAIAPKGTVPALRLEDGQVLTEGAAVLQYLADRNPAAGLAPPQGTPERYRLQEWLSFTATELHKAFLYPALSTAPNTAVKEYAALRLPTMLGVAARHLEGGDYLLGAWFTVADSYLFWALLLMRPAGVDLSPWPSLLRYMKRVRERPAVLAALAEESRLLPRPAAR